MVETLLVIVLLCLSVPGAFATARASLPVGILLVLLPMLLALALGAAIPQVGSLFRLRLADIVPLCLLAGGSGSWQLTRARRWAGSSVRTEATAAG